MNMNNERLMAILVALRKLPRWALILITVGIIVVLGVAMFLLLPQSGKSQGDAAYLNSTSLAFSVFLKLGIVVVLIVGLAIILKRWQSKSRTNQSKMINVLETVHLTPHRTLYLIKLENQKLLIGATDQTLTNLCQFNVEDIPSGSDLVNSTNNFSDLLNQAKSGSDNSKNTLI
jgi:flagellar biosynthetic protein FliO